MEKRGKIMVTMIKETNNTVTSNIDFQWETPNPIEALQEILGIMKAIEQNYFNAKKTEEELNNQQSDLLHALELDLDNEELDAVNKALRELRIKRRDIKDTVINLTEAQSFIKDNYKFMSEVGGLIQKMQRTAQKVSNRRYFLRDCEAISKVIKMENHRDIIHAYVPPEERLKEATVTKNEPTMSRVEQFEKKWGIEKVI